MEFEFDPVKSAANKEKHGIDFIESQELWADLRRLIVPARSADEPRSALIAEWHGKLWTCIFTPRDEKIRIISTRRARDEEEDRYNHG